MSILIMTVSFVITIGCIALAVKLWCMADDIRAIRKKYLEKEDKEREEQQRKQNGAELEF